MSRKSFQEKAQFHFVVDTILTNFEEANVALLKFADSDLIGESVKKIQQIIVSAWQQILQEVENDTSSMAIPDDFFESNIPDEALQKEAEKQVQDLYNEGKIDALSELLKQNSRIQQEGSEQKEQV